MARILVAGIAVADFVFRVPEMPSRPDKYKADEAAVTGGGCGGNAAVAVARLGGSAVLAARLGDDPVGDIILAGLDREGVDTSLVHRAPGGVSSFSSIYVDDAGERQIMNFPGSGLAQTAAWLDEARGADAVLADTRWSSLTRSAIAVARRLGVPAVVDAEAPVDLDALSGASHIAFSRRGLADLEPTRTVDEALRAVAAQTGAWVCVTDGADGVHVLNGNTVERVAAFAVDPVDTLGAGDIWHGAFALRLGEGASEHDAIVFANAAAGLKCRQFGGRDGCPRRAETERFLEEVRECI